MNPILNSSTGLKKTFDNIVKKIADKNEKNKKFLLRQQNR